MILKITELSVVKVCKEYGYLYDIVITLQRLSKAQVEP